LRTRRSRSLLWRTLKASWRDTRLLFNQFRWPLVALAAAILGGGLLYFRLAQISGEPPALLIEAIYHVLGLTFLQPFEEFPRAWYLELFYFIMPLIGIGVLAQGVADFGVLFFNRKARGKEWEMAVASTFNNHIVVIGLGHLGFRVVHNLHQFDQEVVAVELNPSADLVENIQKLGIPVLQDDGSRQATLEAAGIVRARTLVLCTQNDSLNLKIALKARSINPDIHVVLRIFDDDFAQALQTQFGFHAFSATGMAAPAFVSAAVGVDMTRPITVEGESLSLAHFKIWPGSPLGHLTVGDLEVQYEVSLVLIRRDGESDYHPASDRPLSYGDVLAILGGPHQINAVIHENRA